MGYIQGEKTLFDNNYNSQGYKHRPHNRTHLFIPMPESECGWDEMEWKQENDRERQKEIKFQIVQTEACTIDAMRHYSCSRDLYGFDVYYAFCYDFERF